MDRTVKWLAGCLLIASIRLTAQGSTGAQDAPLVRGPGVNQETLEAMAEAQGRPALADHLDHSRPGAEAATRIHKLVERGQSLWLSGSIPSARGIFKEIVNLTLEADWREPQREAIHYAHLRLAQSSPTSTERDVWLEKAAVAFPDLQADTDAFPPPLLESYRTTRSRVIGLAKSYAPYVHFPDHRFLLLNGKRFVLTPELKIRLPRGTFRVTVLSDLRAPITEKLTSSQLEVFRLALPLLASGTCEKPSILEGAVPVKQLAVAYSADCIRTKTASGWRATELDEIESSAETFNRFEGSSQSSSANFPSPKKSIFKKPWFWAGLSIAAVGLAYTIQRSQKRETSASAAPESQVKPVHREGF